MAFVHALNTAWETLFGWGKNFNFELKIFRRAGIEPGTVISQVRRANHLAIASLYFIIKQYLMSTF